MGKPVPLPDLPTDDGLMLVEFGRDWDELCRMWRMVLAMAVRDGASSVHYHPWRADGHLSYLVAGVRYEMVPPHPELAHRVAAAAGALVCGSRLGAMSRRWLGWPSRAGGRVRLTGQSGESEWAGVVWAVGPLAGVEWFRLDPAPTEAEPDSWTPDIRE